jgi:hypothetical protein
VLNMFWLQCSFEAGNSMPELHSSGVNSQAGPVPPGGAGGGADRSSSGRSQSEELVCIYKMGVPKFLWSFLSFYETCGIMSECLYCNNFYSVFCRQFLCILCTKSIKLTHTSEVQCLCICPFQHRNYFTVITGAWYWRACSGSCWINLILVYIGLI